MDFVHVVLRQYLLVNVNRYAKILCDLYGIVRGARIDQYDLVQKRHFFEETFFHGVYNVPDSLRLIEGGQSQAYGQPLFFPDAP